MNSTAPKLAWTGERMIPFESDPVTEFFHWQRYLYFRPWYQGVKVIDAASGEGYGANYAAVFAERVSGIDLSEDAVAHAANQYPSCQFKKGDVCEADYSGADLVLSFETIEHLPDPKAFLARLAQCKGRIVVSTPNRLNHSPGNGIEDKPLNEFHTIEWTPTEFAHLVEEVFSERTIRFLSQENRFPGLIREGLSDEAKYVIAVIGDGELPAWPKVGISIPTCNGAQRLQDAIFNFSRFYPGELEVAVVANGSSPTSLEALEQMQAAWPHIVKLIESPENLGYGRGANVGMERLLTSAGCQYIGVSNDDVIPTIDCVSSMVLAMSYLEKEGQRPGCVGPVSNSVNGHQRVDIGSFQNYREMMEQANVHRQKNAASMVQAVQIRGLFFLTTPDVLREIGGFDPVFGLGNFEDDDWNVRLRLAGYTLWIAEGAFLYHAGSATFSELKLDYSKNIERNLKLFLEKWGVSSHEQAFQLENVAKNRSLFVPLHASCPSSGHSMTFGQENVDLVWQASETEFAAAVMLLAKEMPRQTRQEVLDLLHPPTSSRCAA